MKKTLMATLIASSLVVLSSQALAAKNTLPDLENSKWVNNLSYQIDSGMTESQHNSRLDIYVSTSPKDRRNVWAVYSESVENIDCAEPPKPECKTVIKEVEETLCAEVDWMPDPNNPDAKPPEPVCEKVITEIETELCTAIDWVPDPKCETAIDTTTKKMMRLGRYQYLGLIETASKMPAKWETVVYDQVGLCDAPAKAISFQGHAQAVTSLCSSEVAIPEIPKVSPVMEMLVMKMGRVMKRVKRFGKSPEPENEVLPIIIDDKEGGSDTDSKNPEISNSEQEKDQIARRPSRIFLGFRR